MISSETEAFQLGVRAAQLLDEVWRRDVPGPVLRLVLSRLIAEQHLELLADVVDAIENAEEQRATNRAAADARAEQAREDAAQALTVTCPTCGQSAGEACVTGGGKTPPKPHAGRLVDARGR